MVPQLPQLQMLGLLYTKCSSMDSFDFFSHSNRYRTPVLGADECALLLSPAKLTSLSLDGIALAPFGLSRMLAAGSTALVEFCLSFTDGQQQYQTPLTSSGLGRLVSAWPQLQRLRVTGAVAAPRRQAAVAAAAQGLQHAGWSALQHLTALTRLDVGGDNVTDRVVRDLACLTQLKQLSLHQCLKVTGPGLLQLTQLTGLSWLSINGYNDDDWSRGDEDDDIYARIHLTSKVSCTLLRM
jgi:hypothetical protein